MKEINIGALQLPTLGMNYDRLDFYCKKAHERECKLLLLGEYVINHFFKELITIPKRMVKDQTTNHLKKLKEFSKEYNITIVAPFVEIKKDKIYKKVVKLSPKSTSYAMQQILINYPHWDEESFFDNPVAKLTEPMIFSLEGFKFAVIFGFELHFDYFWDIVRRKRVDIVLLPTASTFGSKQRWQELICSRAFINSCYILRANRVGDYYEDEIKWHFYGESMLVNPDGKIEMKLEDKESMLIEPVSKEVLSYHKRAWGFLNHLRRRGEI